MCKKNETQINFSQLLCYHFIYRLDLEIFSIAPPESINHLCNQDQLLISGGNTAPIICGTSSGDHSKKKKIKIIFTEK